MFMRTIQHYNDMSLKLKTVKNYTYYMHKRIATKDCACVIPSRFNCRFNETHTFSG